ncbi:hypothetical protein PHYPSEUDO_010379 [Phytophthora pseudosyringae]|uniref:Uncharacterized protein n=1 Tax=Phytophthora pseudosyringae TaxID=221518 RepID=A0A8T1WB54_9STRA|nr:hypothetical protein PHYPSEUDO_010379 [Phytophthora pseudosyringae]
MAPKISSVLGFHEREQLHKNTSILAYTGDVGRNYLDLGDGYGEQESEQATTAPPHRRHTSAEKQKATASSRLTSLSSSLNSARTAVASRAKKLHVRESTRQAISQLRKTMAKGPSSRAERSQCKETSASAETQSNQRDDDHFSDAGSQADVQNTSYECMYAEVSLGNETEFAHSPPRGSMASKSRLSRLLPPRPWIKSSTQKRRLSKKLY